MSRYRRANVPGGTFSFTVNLADRRSALLVESIDLFSGGVSRSHARTATCARECSRPIGRVAGMSASTSMLEN